MNRITRQDCSQLSLYNKENTDHVHAECVRPSAVITPVIIVLPLLWKTRHVTGSFSIISQFKSLLWTSVRASEAEATLEAFGIISSKKQWQIAKAVRRWRPTSEIQVESLESPRGIYLCLPSEKLHWSGGFQSTSPWLLLHQCSTYPSQLMRSGFRFIFGKHRILISAAENLPCMSF
jgi:hypothetical protein